MNLPRLLLSLTAAAAVIFTAAAADDTSTRIIDPSFRSLQVKRIDERGNVGLYDAPVITLDGAEQVVVSFDELADDRRYLRYELIHCDSSWQPEGLVDQEFLDSFNEGTIDDYAFSNATLIHYVNYRVAIPNEQIRPRLSGNYLMRIYDESDPDATLLQARFAISEQSATVSAEVSTSTDIDFNRAHQQLNIFVDTQHLNILDPYNGLKVVVTQDRRLDNSVTVDHPLSMNGTTARFEHNRDLIFPAGNEYRRFEVISDIYPGRGTERILFFDPLYHHELYVDSPRRDGIYQYDMSQQGAYLLRRDNAKSPDTDADYVAVHFALAIPPLEGYDIYVEGDLTGRRLDDTSRMVWNPDTQRYELTLLLKQGAYSYQYLAFPSSPQSRRSSAEPFSATATIEGDFSPTQHSYDINVYYRAPGERYDRLAGVATVAFP